MNITTLAQTENAWISYEMWKNNLMLEKSPFFYHCVI